MISVRFTGLTKLIENFDRAPDIVEKAVQKALGLSLASVEMEAKKRTPVATGYLQGSIAGEGGYEYIRGLTAGAGTNVQYAVYVERNDKAHHNNGEAHYMEHGVQAAAPFIKEKFQDAMKEVAVALADNK